MKFTIEPLIFNNKSYIIYLVDLIKQLWEYNFSNISKVIAPFDFYPWISMVLLYADIV